MGFEIDGAVTLITGGNTGIGKETAIALAKQGARVVIASRDASRGKLALDEIRSSSGRDDVELTSAHQVVTSQFVDAAVCDCCCTAAW